MKEERRKELSDMFDKLSNLQDKIEAIAKEEQEEFDNKPIGFQVSMDGLRMETEIKDLKSASYYLDGAMNYLCDNI